MLALLHDGDFPQNLLFRILQLVDESGSSTNTAEATDGAWNRALVALTELFVLGLLWVLAPARLDGLHSIYASKYAVRLKPTCA